MNWQEYHAGMDWQELGATFRKWQNTKAGNCYTIHEDPGHGWLEVPRDELMRLNISDIITPFSYQFGENVFLEEDCDYGSFLIARYRENRPFHTRRDYRINTPIRNYEHYNGGA